MHSSTEKRYFISDVGHVEKNNKIRTDKKVKKPDCTDKTN
jgi:hypothetical protein